MADFITVAGELNSAVNKRVEQWPWLPLYKLFSLFASYHIFRTWVFRSHIRAPRASCASSNLHNDPNDIVCSMDLNSELQDSMAILLQNYDSILHQKNELMRGSRYSEVCPDLEVPRPKVSNCGMNTEVLNFGKGYRKCNNPCQCQWILHNITGHCLSCWVQQYQCLCCGFKNVIWGSAQFIEWYYDNLPDISTKYSGDSFPNMAWWQTTEPRAHQGKPRSCLMPSPYQNYLSSSSIACHQPIVQIS